MRVNSDNYNEFNQTASKELRLVIKIDFPTPIYLTSHAGIPNIPANRIDDCLRDVSSTSQKLFPDQGRSEIGAMSFSAVDVSGAVTAEFRTQQNAGEGLNGRTVELYRGGAGMDWTDFRLEQTQQIDRDVTLSKGAYKIQCADIQRAMRKDICDLAKTALAADFNAGASTLTVFDTTGFDAIAHKDSFGHPTPGGNYGYLKLKYQNGFEIVRWSSKTATTFTIAERGLFGTSDVNHVFPTGEDSDSSVTVEEYVYLELPFPELAYAMLTGTLMDGGSYPASWSLGIDTSLVDLSSFQNIGADWYDSSDYTNGLIFRFQGITKTDGKRFIERELCLLAGAFLRVGADGKIYLRRMTGVIGSADFVAELNVDNVVSHSSVKHNLNLVRNEYDIEWSYVHVPGERRPRFFRRDILVDATSVAIHGRSKPLALQFKGLHNERHTYTTLINRFDALRDRYAGPPITLTADILPSMNDVEVGDIVRLALPNVRDFSGTGTLDRSFEIQQTRVNQRTGRVAVSLFGSTLKADPIADTGAGANSELPDSWYSSAGTEMGAAGLTIDGSGFMTANGSLSGGTTTRTIYYYLGDLTINSGVTLTLTGNVELRVRGQLQINGTIDCSGGGLASNTAGFIGTSYGGPGLFYGSGQSPYPPLGATRVVGDHAAMPVLEIENNSGSLDGIPADMRGSGGGLGGDVMRYDPPWVTEASGGSGGAGGGSVVMVSRGAGFGVSGEVDLSGSDGNTGAVYLSNGAGSGGGGAPGCALFLLDGSQVTFPILAGNIIAQYGTSPITNSEDRTQGKAQASNPIDLSVSAARVAYVPKSRDPYPEYTNTGAGSSEMSIVFQRSITQPSTPAASSSTPSGWYADVGSMPAGAGIIWSSVGTRASGAQNFTWQTPIPIEGQSGLSGLVFNTDDWSTTVTDPMGIWDRNAGSLANTTVVNDEAGPFSEYPLVLKIAGDGTTPGWYSQWRPRFTYDNTRSYIFYCWVMRLSADTDQGLYLGGWNGGGAHLETLAGTDTTNPYFIANAGSQLTVGKWYLAVMNIWPTGYSGGDSGESGIYDPDNGSQVINGTEYRWDSVQYDLTHLRLGFYENTAPAFNTDDGFAFTRFVGWVRDGSEPSIAAVLGAGAVQGEFRDIKFQRNAAQPATPTGDNPSGWFDEVPSGTDVVWSITGTKSALGVLQGVWSTPERLTDISFRGAWSGTADYILHDVVTYQERTYICVQAHTTSNAPSGTNAGNAYWDLLAGKGDPGDAPAAYTQTIAVTGTGPVNLRDLANNHTPAYEGGDATITFQVGSGVTITGVAGTQSGGHGGHGIDTGTWPGASAIDLTLEITGTVRGGGGGGGAGGSGFGGGNGGNAGDAGDAIYLQEDMDITVNVGGVVQAGGGGGGGGGGADYPSGEPIPRGGGGGGGGFPNGAGGAGGAGSSTGAAGSAGTGSGGGAAGAGAGNAGDGAVGGNVNADGTTGNAGTSTGSNGNGGQGGNRGYAVRKNGYTSSVTNNGTITGTEG